MKNLLSLLLAFCLAACLLVPALAVSEAVPAMTLTKNFKKLGYFISTIQECMIFVEGAVGEVTFTSSSPNVAVDSNGRVELILEGASFSGTARIIATTEAGQQASILVEYSVLSAPWYVWFGISPFLLLGAVFGLAFVVLGLPIFAIYALFV